MFSSQAHLCFSVNVKNTSQFISNKAENQSISDDVLGMDKTATDGN